MDKTVGRCVRFTAFCVVLAAVVASAPAGAAPPPSPTPVRPVVQSVVGEGLVTSPSPLDVMAQFRIDYTRSGILRGFLVGKVRLDDPGTAKLIESAVKLSWNVRPWGMNGARGTTVVNVSNPLSMSPLPPARCMMDWYVDDQNNLDRADAGEDRVAVSVWGWDRRCAYKHESVLHGDVVVTYAGPAPTPAA